MITFIIYTHNTIIFTFNTIAFRSFADVAENFFDDWQWRNFQGCTRERTRDEEAFTDVCGNDAILLVLVDFARVFIQGDKVGDIVWRKRENH